MGILSVIKFSKTQKERYPRYPPTLPTASGMGFGVGNVVFYLTHKINVTHVRMIIWQGIQRLWVMWVTLKFTFEKKINSSEETVHTILRFVHISGLFSGILPVNTGLNTFQKDK